MRVVRWVLCKLGYHMRGHWTSKGVRCVDCDFFKSRAEHHADLSCGGGW